MSILTFDLRPESLSLDNVREDFEVGRACYGFRWLSRPIGEVERHDNALNPAKRLDPTHRYRSTDSTEHTSKPWRSVAIRLQIWRILVGCDGSSLFSVGSVRQASAILSYNTLSGHLGEHVRYR
jgi:hypothetical protein